VVEWREVPVDAEAAQQLLTEYFHSREITFVSGTYQVTFPDAAMFVPPAGVFLVAEDESGPIGCGGIRAIAASPTGAVRFEVKHLFLRPSTRGKGYGRALLTELERRAREFGAEELVLDTNDSLAAAGGLYRSSGFTPIEPYNDNPNANVWLRKTLAAAERG
jgi:GNAT superfamily N-acetyltransferase